MKKQNPSKPTHRTIYFDRLGDSIFRGAKQILRESENTLSAFLSLSLPHHSLIEREREREREREKEGGFIGITCCQTCLPAMTETNSSSVTAYAARCGGAMFNRIMLKRMPRDMAIGIKFGF